ncbi:hypothetical protein [Anaerosporobacter sp.]|uniref:hypothetical protein n=1 Tax=Anaerosporobacter sp. TaxID=1872529 RepID=UPI00286ECBA2|nr:hypothetical protein [Anaerosporobacter sp.]
MILYHASTVYHTLCCIVHKLSIHREEEATLFIVEYMLPTAELQSFIKKLKRMDWFDDIRIVPEKNFRFQRGFELTEESSQEEIELVIQNICNALENWYKPGFKHFDEYYVAADNWSVGVYLLKNKIPYNYFEDASGIMGDTERFLRIIRDLNETNYIISNYLGGVGRCSIVKHLYCDLESQDKNFYDTRAIDFTIYKSVLQMKPSDVNQLLELYGCDTYPIKQEEKNVLFLSQRLPTLVIQKIEVQERMTVLLMDYFCYEYNIIVKPHPKDVWIDYKKLISGCHVVDRSVPSELLPFLLKGEEGQNQETTKFSLCITPNSTSIHGLSHIAEATMCFGNDFETNYERLHIYYIVSRFLQVIHTEEHVITDSIAKGYLRYFLKQQGLAISFEEEDVSANNIFIKSDSNSESTSYDMQTFETIIFLNEENSYELLLKKDLVPQAYRMIEYEVINSIDERVECVGTIWLYLSDERIRKKMDNWKGSRELEHTGATLNYQLKECNELKIAKGKIKAMEYAMQHPSETIENKKKEEII